MSDDHHAARDRVSTLTHTELLEFETTYHEAQEVHAATGTVSADLAARLTETPALYARIVQALALDRLHERRET